jgi:hypothetical protein
MSPSNGQTSHHLHENLLVIFITSVGAAALCFILEIVVSEEWVRLNLEHHHYRSTMVIVGLFVLFALVFSAAPFAIMAAIAQNYHITRWVYYAGWGVSVLITASMLLGYVLTSLLPHPPLDARFNTGDDVGLFWSTSGVAMIALGPPAIGATLTNWLLLRKVVR